MFFKFHFILSLKSYICSTHSISSFILIFLQKLIKSSQIGFPDFLSIDQPFLPKFHALTLKNYIVQLSNLTSFMVDHHLEKHHFSFFLKEVRQTFSIPNPIFTSFFQSLRDSFFLLIRFFILVLVDIFEIGFNFPFHIVF
jgi:hypothetical protein